MTHPKGKLRGNPKPDPVREISWVVPPPPLSGLTSKRGGEVGVISSAVNLGYVRLAVCILRRYSEHGPAHQEDFEKKKLLIVVDKAIDSKHGKIVELH